MFAAGVLAALLLVATEFTTVASVEVAGDSCEVISDSEPELAERCELSGFERNGGAFLLLAALAARDGLGRRHRRLTARRGGAVRDRRARAGLGAPGGPPGDAARPARSAATSRARAATPAPGLVLELAAGVLALGAGVIRLLSADVD